MKKLLLKFAIYIIAKYQDKEGGIYLNAPIRLHNKTYHICSITQYVDSIEIRAKLYK